MFFLLLRPCEANYTFEDFLIRNSAARMYHDAQLRNPDESKRERRVVFCACPPPPTSLCFGGLSLDNYRSQGVFDGRRDPYDPTSGTATAMELAIDLPLERILPFWGRSLGSRAVGLKCSSFLSLLRLPCSMCYLPRSHPSASVGT